MEDGQEKLPRANIPRVEFPVAAPNAEALLAAVAEPLVSHAYVYLLRVVERPPLQPIANIPLVLFPAADPPALVTLEDVAPALASHAYVYLFRVADTVHEANPKANIPRVAFPAAEP